MYVASINIGNSTVETDNSGSKKSTNLQVISGLGYARRSKLSIHNEKFQVSSEITWTLRLEVGRHCFGFFSS
jgi:ABC-type arginine transport system ATPase subunit